MAKKKIHVDWVMMRPKDRQKAFLWAAEAFGTPYNRRTEYQKELTSRGICRAIWRMIGLRGSTQLVRLGHKMKITELFWWPWRGGYKWTPSCDKQRSLFCYLMAALSKEEFEELQ